MTDGKSTAYIRIAVVQSVEKFMDVNSGCYFHLIKLRRTDKEGIVGIETTIVSREKMFRKGQMVKIEISRRER
jgi:hypothetical protein